MNENRTEQVYQEPSAAFDRERFERNARRIGRVLRSVGVQSREDLVTRYDKGRPYRDIKGIGDVLGSQLYGMVHAYEREGWEAATGMPWERKP